MEPRRAVPYQQQVTWSVAVALPTAGAGAQKFHMGFASEGGLLLKSVWIVTNTDVTASGSNYQTCKPYILTRNRDGTTTVRFLGTVATQTQTIKAGVPTRLTDKENVNERLPRGAVVGVEITGFGGSASNDNVVLQANLVKIGD